MATKFLLLLTWLALTSAAYCWSLNDAVANKSTYGALYNAYCVIDRRNIAPIGWHVPSSDEWETLLTFLGGESVAGTKLKESGTTHWVSPNTGATNSSGFTALPGGRRSTYNGFCLFINLGRQGMWWSRDYYCIGPVPPGTGMRGVESNYDALYFSEFSTQYYWFGCSVRCIRD